jgi:transposase InsO family protein
MKRTQQHRVAPNILSRAFQWFVPLRKLWTDITYLRFKWRWIYLSIVKDMITGEILAFWISDNLSMNIIQKTFKQLNTKFKYQDLKWALIHSDQWFHYTHPYFQRQVQALGCIQSMSRKGNCIDNAPTESFFWHFKDEIDISIYETLEEVEKYTEQYIFYYNNYRPQWTRKKMTPVQYRNHLLQNQS